MTIEAQLSDILTELKALNAHLSNTPKAEPARRAAKTETVKETPAEPAKPAINSEALLAEIKTAAGLLFTKPTGAATMKSILTERFGVARASEAHPDKLPEILAAIKEAANAPADDAMDYV